MTKISHVIIGLNIGGAELMLKRLIEEQLKQDFFQHTVISLTDIGPTGEQLKSMGIEVYSLGIRGVFDYPIAFFRLISLLRLLRPGIVQTWMYHSDFFGAVAARIAGVKTVVWNIRNTNISRNGLSLHFFFLRLLAFFSFVIPDKIICCSHAALHAHMQLGYCHSKMLVIPNGYDLTNFFPTDLLKRQTRHDFGIQFGHIVIGVVGRFDFLKDYKNFIDAIGILSKERENLFFLFIGKGLDSQNDSLLSWLESADITKNYLLLGERNDVITLMSSMDIFCLPSRAEGFPNAVAEAMAMEVPCVVTDVGDAALIVRDAGLVVPPGNSLLLSQALKKMVDSNNFDRINAGKYSRKIIQDFYSIQTASDLYLKLYLQLKGENYA